MNWDLLYHMIRGHRLRGEHFTELGALSMTKGENATGVTHGGGSNSAWILFGGGRQMPTSDATC